MEAFIWMFKEKEFKKHFFYLFFCVLILTAILIGISFYLYFNPVIAQVEPRIYIALWLLIYGLVIGFLLNGYYFELTENIINRDYDIQASNLYDGNVKKLIKFELPTLDLKKLLWRGFASTIAIIIMLIPCFLIILISKSTGNINQVPWQLYLTAAALFLFLVPGLMWNYAMQNSVVATLNIPKAVYIMGNYPLQYFKTILMLLGIFSINFLYHFISSLIMNISGIREDLFNPDVIKIIILLIYVLIDTTIRIYCIFANAYILGTLVPTDEG